MRGIRVLGMSLVLFACSLSYAATTYRMFVKDGNPPRYIVLETHDSGDRFFYTLSEKGVLLRFSMTSSHPGTSVIFHDDDGDYRYTWTFEGYLNSPDNGRIARVDVSALPVTPLDVELLRDELAVGPWTSREGFFDYASERREISERQDFHDRAGAYSSNTQALTTMLAQFGMALVGGPRESKDFTIIRGAWEYTAPDGGRYVRFSYSLGSDPEMVIEPILHIDGSGAIQGRYEFRFFNDKSDEGLAYRKPGDHRLYRASVTGSRQLSAEDALKQALALLFPKGAPRRGQGFCSQLSGG